MESADGPSGGLSPVTQLDLEEQSTNGVVHAEALKRQCPARIRPLASQRTRPRQSWLTVPLAATWALHLLLLAPLFLQELVFFLSSDSYDGHVVHGIAVSVCTLVVFIEVALRLWTKLRPKTILITQICKAAAWTIIFLLVIFAADESKRIKNTSVIVFLVFVSMATAYGMLAYTIFKARRAARRWRWQQNLNSAGLDMEHLPVVKAVGPLEVNQASSLKHNSPMILQMVNWVQIKAIQARRTEGFLYSTLAWVSVTLRYIAISMLGGLFLAVSRRLPGEPPSFTSQPWQELFSCNRQRGDSGPGAVYDAIESLLDQRYPRAVLPRSFGSDRAGRLRRRRLAISRSSHAAIQHDQTSAISEAALYSDPEHLTPPRRPHQPVPAMLCFLTENDTNFYTCDVETWRAAHGADTGVPYVFISYTRRQFPTVNLNDTTTDVLELKSWQHKVAQSRTILLDYAVNAAKRAGVRAFWIDFECVRPGVGASAGDCMLDVYSICDVVRLAKSMAIVIGPCQEADGDQELSDTEKKTVGLRQWSDRLWTVPEALLSPSQYDIAIYYSEFDELVEVPKRNFARRAYHDDADTMQRLIDHHERSLTLGPLEYNSLALECLQRRQTQKRMAGDVAYALMGLQSQRPDVRGEDSAFQAFARLSFANDNNKLLERMICLSPKVAPAPWYDLTDEWGARLWHITPECDIVEIDGEASVLLGNAKGTLIHWSHLELVEIRTSSTPKKAVWGFLRANSLVSAFFLLSSTWLAIFIVYFLAAAFFLPDEKQGKNDNLGRQRRDAEPGEQKDGVNWLKTALELSELFCLLFTPFIPRLLMYLQKGEIESSQPRFFGCEGEPDPDVVEQRIFGSSNGTLQVSEHPQTIPAADMRRFTLIDSLDGGAMTSFWASEPPQVVLVCGRERGMLRAALCSYDWDANALRRETIVRLDATAMERMHPMNIVKYNFRQ